MAPTFLLPESISQHNTPDPVYLPYSLQDRYKTRYYILLQSHIGFAEATPKKSCGLPPEGAEASDPCMEILPTYVPIFPAPLDCPSLQHHCQSHPPSGWQIAKGKHDFAKVYAFLDWQLAMLAISNNTP